MVRSVTLVYTDNGFDFADNDGQRVVYANGVFKSFLEDDDDWIYADSMFEFQDAVQEALFLLEVIERYD